MDWWSVCSGDSFRCNTAEMSQQSHDVTLRKMFGSFILGFFFSCWSLMMIVYVDMNFCLNVKLTGLWIQFGVSVCVFVPGESGESSGYQHSQWQRIDLRPKLWTHRLSCRVKPRLLWLTCLPPTSRLKVKVEPCCHCPQSEPDCVCVSDVSSCCFTRRRTSRVTSSTRPGEPTCPLHHHLLSRRVTTGSDSPFYSGVLVLWRTKEARFYLTEVLVCKLTRLFNLLLKFWWVFHLKQFHCFYTF